MPKRGPSPAERQEQERKLQQQLLAEANQVKARGGRLNPGQQQALLQEQKRQKELQRQQQAAEAAKKAADEAAAKKAADEAEIKNRADYYRQQQEQAIGPAQQDQAIRQQMYLDQPQSYRNPDKNMSPEELEAVRGGLAARKDQMVRMEPQVTPYNKFSRIPKDYQPISKDGMNLENGPKKEPVIMYKPGREIEPPERRINLDQFIVRERRPITPNPLRLGPQQQFNSMQQQMYQTEPAEPQPEITPPVQKQEEPKIPAQQTTQAKQQEQQPVQPIKRKMIKRIM